MKHYDRSFMEKYPLSPKKIWKKTLLWIGYLWYLVGLSIFLVGYIVLRLVAEDSTWLTSVSLPMKVLYLFLIALAAVILAIIPVYLYQRWYIKTYFYNLTDDLIIIRKGPLAPQEITIPYERIQDIYVDQDIIDRLFNIYDVHIASTTAMSGARAHIDGVDRETAEQLRELILQKVRSSIGKR